jgi:hypothetical protein
MYFQRPQEKDFKMRVVCEERALQKMGTRGTGFGRRLAYLHIRELQGMSRKLRLQVRL